MPQLGSAEPNTDNRNLFRPNTSLQHQFSPVPGCSAERPTRSKIRARTNREFSGNPINQTALCYASNCSPQPQSCSPHEKRGPTARKSVNRQQPERMVVIQTSFFGGLGEQRSLTEQREKERKLDTQKNHCKKQTASKTGNVVQTAKKRFNRVCLAPKPFPTKGVSKQDYA